MSFIDALIFSGRAGHFVISSFKSSGKSLGTHRAHFWCKKVSEECSGTVNFCSKSVFRCFCKCQYLQGFVLLLLRLCQCSVIMCLECSMGFDSPRQDHI